MPNNDLVLRAAAIECAIDAVDDWDGGWNPSRETVIRKYFEELPTVDAIPVKWLEWRAMNAKYNGIKEAADAFDFVLKCWKEQEAQDG